MGMERKVLIIDGMTCINCQNKIEQELKNTAGISKVQVSYSKGQAEIEFIQGNSDIKPYCCDY